MIFELGRRRLTDDRGQCGFVADIGVTVVTEHRDRTIRRLIGVSRKVTKYWNHDEAITLDATTQVRR
jgi:hypothetical protein